MQVLKLFLYAVVTAFVAVSLIVCLRSGRYAYRGVSGSRSETPARYWAVIVFLATFTGAGVLETFRLAQRVLGH